MFALAAWALPYALAPRGARQPEAAWYQLLSEPGGGYSLARVQLLLWSLPVVVIYGAMSVASRSFLSIDTQLQILLGLSGATTFISTAASPPDAERTSGAPSLSDMVTDWNGHGDVSRFQYLLLSLFGAVVVVVSFLQKLELPQIPTELLWLVGGSQATYVATKAVKQAQATTASAGGSPAREALVVSAPATLVPLANAPEGEAVPAPPELATADGSIRLPG